MITTYCNLSQFRKRQLSEEETRSVPAKRPRLQDIDDLNSYHYRKERKEDQSLEACRCCHLGRRWSDPEDWDRASVIMV